MEWLVPRPGSQILDLAGGSAPLALELLRRRHQVVAVARSAEALAHAERHGIPVALAQTESLPFRAGLFDVVTSADTLADCAPGLTHPELARVLHPEGHLAVVITTRDDTVPWVKRLARAVQEVDPEAMQGRYGQDVVDDLVAMGSFTGIERRDIRNWIPVTRETLVDMVARRPAVLAAADDVRDALLAEVGGIYDSVARPPEPLLLPFQSSCWRARPVPREPELGDDVLTFSL